LFGVLDFSKEDKTNHNVVRAENILDGKNMKIKAYRVSDILSEICCSANYLHDDKIPLKLIHITYVKMAIVW
jgi:hypothetical protein